MPLHPQVKAFLDLVAGAPDLPELGIFTVRKGSYADPEISGKIDQNVKSINKFITAPTADILIRIYQPPQKTRHNGMVYFHGGGWSVFSVDMYDAQLSALSVMTNSVIVSVNYQKAPEHKFPIPHDDCFAGLEWIFENAESLGIDPTKIGIGGDSSGGNLASGVALRNRDEGRFQLAYQLLIYPCNGTDYETDSYHANAEGYGLTRKGMIWLWEQYLVNDSDKSNPYAVPLSAKDLTNLPPAIIITAEFDPLHDEGGKYADALKAVGNSVSFRDYPGMIHGFFNYGKYIEEGISVRTYIAEQILTLLGDAKD